MRGAARQSATTDGARVRGTLLAILITTWSSTTVGAAAPSAEAVWGAHCARCHAPNEIRARIQEGWLERSAGDLLERVRQTMPAESPGSLSQSEYEQSVRHLLKLAGVPSAANAALSEISIRQSVEASRLPDVPWRHFGGELNANR